jgi:mannose-6-phosphate isomerase-like protein (cupin superfamily)
VKFPFEKAIWKNAFGIDIVEHCVANNPFPIDCAIAKFRNNEYPWKINHNFHEMFYVLEGECFIEFDDETVHLKKQDVHVIEPGRAHTTRAEYADILIVCTPPFDIKNAEFLDKPKTDTHV